MACVIIHLRSLWLSSASRGVRRNLISTFVTPKDSPGVRGNPFKACVIPKDSPGGRGTPHKIFLTSVVSHACVALITRPP